MLVRYRFLLSLALFVSFVGTLAAQWTNSGVSVGRTGGTAAFGGYVCYRDGVVWAGHDKLLRSDDLGLTWKPVTIPQAGTIFAIDFLDAKVGAIGTVSGLYATSDGGASWRKVNFNDGWQFTIDRFSGDWYYMSSSPYAVYISKNQGGTWTTSYTATNYTTAMRSNNQGSVYITQSPGGTRSRVMQTTNRGATWNTLNGLVDLDSHEMIFDSCDRSRIYVMNEDIASTPDNFSSIFVSTDGGQSFTMSGSNPIVRADPRNYTGGFAESAHALFAQRLDQITRSTDRGLTWKDVGGPAGHIDAQYVCAITDNIVLALDTNGIIWRTTNAGGDSIAGTSSALASPGQLFVRDTTALCSSLTRALAVLGGACGPASIVSVDLNGPDAVEFVVTRSGYGPDGDSIEISFIPMHPGVHNATAVVRMSDGSTLTVPLVPLASTRSVAVLKPVRTMQQDTIGGDVTVSVGESFLLPTVQNSSGFRIYAHYDPRQLVYVSAESDAATIDAHDANGTLTIDVVPTISRGDVVTNIAFHFFPEVVPFTSGEIHGDTEFCSRIVIDSIKPIEAFSCSVASDTAIVVDVCSSLSCGMSHLSQFVRQEPIVLRISPNPANLVVDVAATRPIDGVIRVLDITGGTVLVSVIRDGHATLDIRPLGRSVFAVELTTEDEQRLYSRFVKQ